MLERDLVTNEWIVTLSSDGSGFRNHARAHVESSDLKLGYTLTRRHCIQGEDPLSARTEVAQTVLMERDGWSVRIESLMRLEARAEHFRLTGWLHAFENGHGVRVLDWIDEIPRETLH